MIVLAPENTGKLCNRWQGPGTVVKVKLPHSYRVDMGGGNIRHLHANNMRQFVARIQRCGVIAERDFDFGRIVVPDVNNTVSDESKSPSRRLEAADIQHLEPQQRSDLLSLLDEFSDCFAGASGRCDVVTHRIVTTPYFVPKHMRPYRVPEIFRAEVNKQIKELLDQGLIRPSSSPMASPIVCVAKKDGGVRIDHQVPVREQDRWLTAFVTHDGLYEWVRMPFGLKNAGATFVRAVRSVLQPINDFSTIWELDRIAGVNIWSTSVNF